LFDGRPAARHFLEARAIGLNALESPTFELKPDRRGLATGTGGHFGHLFFVDDVNNVTGFSGIIRQVKK
jgi:hypothetical protein